MNKIIYIISLFTLVVIFITSCEKKVTTEDVSQITYFVTFELDGQQVMTLPQGTPYSEPGFTAKEDVDDVTNEVTIEGEVIDTVVGLYTLSYSAINKDGYESSIVRTVIVYDPTAPDIDISGRYLSTVARVSPAESYTDLDSDETPIMVSYVAPGFFEFTHLLGGFYALGREYGNNYAMHGYLKLNADNSLEYISSFLPGWGDSLDGISDGTYNPVTGEISFSSYYVVYQFNITLTPKP